MPYCIMSVYYSMLTYIWHIVIYWALLRRNTSYLCYAGITPINGQIGIFFIICFHLYGTYLYTYINTHTGHSCFYLCKYLLWCLYYNHINAHFIIPLIPSPIFTPVSVFMLKDRRTSAHISSTPNTILVLGCNKLVLLFMPALVLMQGPILRSI